MTESARNQKRIESNERIAAADRESKEKIAGVQAAASKKAAMISAVGRVAGVVAGGAGKVAGRAMGKVFNAGRAVFGNTRQDPEWYLRVPGGLEQSTLNIPQFFKNGYYKAHTFIPSVFVVVVRHAYGPTRGYSGGVIRLDQLTVNKAAKRLKAILRHYNSRVGGYEPSDLMQYQIAGCELAERVENLRRAMSAYLMYNATNPNLAQLIIEGCGFDYDDFDSNYANYRVKLNECISIINNNIYVCTDISYVARKLYLASHVFMDEKGKNSQIIFVTHGDILEYSEEDHIIRSKAVPTTYADWVKAWYDSAYDLIHGSFADDILTDIMGDKAIPHLELPYFEGKGCELVISDDENFKSQVMNATLGVNVLDDAAEINGNTRTEIAGHNAFILGPDFALSDLGQPFNLTQNSAGILTTNVDETNVNNTIPDDFCFKGNSYESSTSTTAALKAAFDRTNAALNDTPLNFYLDKVDGGNIMEATRLRCGVGTDDHSWTDPSYPTQTRHLISHTAFVCGTEVPVFGLISSTNGTNQFIKVSSLSKYIKVAGGGSFAGASAIKTKAMMDAINYFPIIPWADASTAGSTYSTEVTNVDCYMSGQWYTTFKLPFDSLDDLHVVALESMFYAKA